MNPFEQEQAHRSIYESKFYSTHEARQAIQLILDLNPPMADLLRSYKVKVDVVSYHGYEVLTIVGPLTGRDLEDVHQIVTQAGGILLRMNPDIDSQQSSSNNRGMKCSLGIHNWNKCVCARCGAKKQEKRPDISMNVNMDIVDIIHNKLSPNDKIFKDMLQKLRENKEVQAVLRQHDWHGCKCFVCDTQHIFVHVASSYTGKRVSSTDGLYRQLLICAICGHLYGRDKAEWDTIL